LDEIKGKSMSMTITEKILARAAGKGKVTPGELVEAKIDVVMCHDVTTPPALSMLAEKGDREGIRQGRKIVVNAGPFFSRLKI